MDSNDTHERADGPTLSHGNMDRQRNDVWGGYSPDLNTGGRYNPSTDSWTATSTTNAPLPRKWHTAVWTGSEMIVWGGGDCCNFFDTGGRYNPSTDSWTATS